MTYPRYSQLFPSVQAVRDSVEGSFLNNQQAIEAQAVALVNSGKVAEAKSLLTSYTVDKAQTMLDSWKKLGEYLIVKYNDQAVKPERNGKFTRTPDGLGTPPARPGFPEKFKETIVKTTGDKYLIP